MSSWVKCPCGNELPAGAFPNPGLHRIISGEEYDAVTDQVDRTKLAVLFLRGRELVECGNCGRILIRGRNDTEWAVYVREPHQESELPSDTSMPGDGSTS